MARKEFMAVKAHMITEDDYQEMDDNCQGICIGCKEIADGVEPDAERYTCDNCGAKSVYGVEVALELGFIDIEGENEDDDESEDSDDE